MNTPVVAEPSEPERCLAPFSTLTPDRILDALDSVGLRPDGRLQALNSYENRVYLVYEETESYVAKFYRAGRWSDAQIVEEHEFAAELVSEQVPVVAPLRMLDKTLHHYQDLRFAVFARRGGRSPETEDLESLQWIGRFIARIHLVGRSKPFLHRPEISLRSFGDQALDAIKAAEGVPADLHAAYFSVAQQALDTVQERLQVVGGMQAFGWQRIHADCHLSNILWTPPEQTISDSGERQWRGGPHFVDFDDARMGPPVQDLWMLLGGDTQNNRDQAERQLGALVEGYETFCEFDDASLGLIEPLRTLRLLHYSAWLTQRWHDPAFPAAFPWFNTPRYWQDRILELREQIAAMHEPALRIKP